MQLAAFIKPNISDKATIVLYNTRRTSADRVDPQTPFSPQIQQKSQNFISQFRAAVLRIIPRFITLSQKVKCKIAHRLETRN